MSIHVKPGRWRTRGGGEVMIEDNESGSDSWPWRGRLATGGRMTWASDGRYFMTESLSDLVEFLGETEHDIGTIKHDAVKALVASAEAMKSMLDPDDDGTHAMRLADFIIVNAKALEVLTRPEIT